MSTLLRTLQDLSPAMLRVLAETNGVVLSNNTPRAMASELAQVLADPTHLAEIVASMAPEAGDALARLVQEDGRIVAAAFERRYGPIRAFGPGRLERERPHRSPVSVSETLWYLGLIYRTFAETPEGLTEFLAVPDDLAPLLPRLQLHDQAAVFRVSASSGPADVAPASDALLHDVCSLLCLVQAGEARPGAPGEPPSWRTTSLYALADLMLQPVEGSDLIDQRAPGSMAALAFALVNDAGWLRAAGNAIRLDAQPVHGWLLESRAGQRRALMDVWRGSASWNDLCRTPALSCEETGSWDNDPAATRARLLPLLASLVPGTWYSVAGFIDAVKEHAPDFQRPDGDYGTWYIRRRDDPVFLRGFERWDEVEGELLRFLLAGPLSWLAAVLIGKDGAGAPIFRLTDAGARWLADETPVESPCAGRPVVLSDFTVEVPADAPLIDRFRVARFTTWEPVVDGAAPLFRYRITQTGLRRAARQGVSPERVLAYLRERCGEALPANVAAALAGWQT
ncbi:MAG: hypothetical protein R2844_15860 [Caldilineales bacterium]